MESVVLDISSALRIFCDTNSQHRSIQQLCSKQNWNADDRRALLSALSDLLVSDKTTADVAKLFRNLLLDLLYRAIKKIQKSDSIDVTAHQHFCVTLSRLISMSREVKCLAFDYLRETLPFYRDGKEEAEDRNIVKKTRFSQNYETTLNRNIMEAVYRLVQCFGQKIGEAWNQSELLHHLSSEDKHVQWCVVHSVARLLGMSSKRLNDLLSQLFTDGERITMCLRFDGTIERSLSMMSLLNNTDEPVDEGRALMRQAVGPILRSDLCEEVTSVCGVLLTTLPETNNLNVSGRLTMVPSTYHNLHRIALAVAVGTPVLLEGPVGCGKTSLVEHLASMVGRTKSPQLIKLQLGDQTDSKALVGTYRCTDIPGQFVWQSGCLVDAVQGGHWLLLEDLDYAPMDVVSVLIPLLETGSLSLPGYGSKINAAPGFRIFATQRLVASGSGWHQQQHSCSHVLERLWRRIRVEPLSRSELEQIIIDRYPSLKDAVKRLLDVYFLLSSGKHETDSEEDMSLGDSDIGRFIMQDGRPISTRDLMKWCERISVTLEGSQTISVETILMDALDCFSACLPLAGGRLPVARAICAKIGFAEAKAEYYCCSYIPEIKLHGNALQIGRSRLEVMQQTTSLDCHGGNFAFTRPATALLEQIAVCIRNNEPVLLVGETGTGKTSIVQYTADKMHQTLHVINLNQQSDMTDLLGGFKPVDLRLLVIPFVEEFEILFCESFSRVENQTFLGYVQQLTRQRRWKDLFQLMRLPYAKGLEKYKDDMRLHGLWLKIGKRLLQLESLIRQTESCLAFTFIEGVLVRALRNGSWVLLDEINLATAETLECLCGLLESTTGSVVLTERGDTEPVERHPNFRLFACMNPAADVGKKDLPLGIRNRFTELFVDELREDHDLGVLIESYLRAANPETVQGIVAFYQAIREMAAEKLIDGTGRHPHYSLRTLCRALRQASQKTFGGVKRSIYEAFRLSFLTQLDRSSYPMVDQLIKKCILQGQGQVDNALRAPPGDRNVNVEGYWITRGEAEPVEEAHYIMTASVCENLRDVARVVSAGKLPILIQGETSVGKTSLITYLAKRTGNICYRINNHEHTDIQEYLGCYSADNTGKLVFREGILVEAMRKGYWIILDELNLAPTDVLEAVNRLLDDNRELFIPETQEVVKAHPRFILFATQNPPGLYGGRKVLSRAFRNRFVELHFDTIPSEELIEILHKRCWLAKKHCILLVDIMLDLQTKRRSSGLFAGKQAFITLRDLFRWAERHRLEKEGKDWDQLLADNGFMLLAGRMRQPEDEQLVKEVIEKHFRRKVDPERIFTFSSKTSATTRGILERILARPPSGFDHVVWTMAMRRMAVLVAQALKFGEPVLLVGETGCGKTTICQLYAQLEGRGLHSINCHMHTESSDFLGGLRPVRNKSQNTKENQKLFEWCDGPLVTAMKEGATFLVDEISLADDSVLERLNSVLETERTLLLVEKGCDPQNDLDKIIASPKFRIVATMNPGGDYGKKELSPALRNRFTEIWCPMSGSKDDLIRIVEHNLKREIRLNRSEAAGLGSAMLEFTGWLQEQEFGRRCIVTIRDLLSWVSFINKTVNVAMEMDAMETGEASLDPAVAYVHGAFLVFVDCLGSSTMDSSSVSQSCLQFLSNQMRLLTEKSLTFSDLGMMDPNSCSPNQTYSISYRDKYFGFHPFYITRGSSAESGVTNYAFGAPTTSQNALRVMRALQLRRPILLEGSPGVGKTSLVAALAKAAGHHLVRINLSEQTDVTDLFGADLPVEGGKGGEFAWRDGPLLSALKDGHWIVFDELNLASQSVLEGLNACFDHRSEVFIPELGITFHIQHEKTRLFACQNPLSEGGGRKGLPKSFLNRFTQVYVDPLTKGDLLFIAEATYPQLGLDSLTKMVEFNQTIYNETVVARCWGQKGGPWEFNLRDLFRWCQLMLDNQAAGFYEPDEFVPLLYVSRMRTVEDRKHVIETFEKVFCQKLKDRFTSRHFSITYDYIQVGNSFLRRRTHSSEANSWPDRQNLRLLHHCLRPLSALMKCVEMNWMTILIGSSCTGKTSLVELLARLTGTSLKVLPMNSATDTTELLGGFEQASLLRQVEELDDRVKSLCHEVVSCSLSSCAGSPGIKEAGTVLDFWNREPRLPSKGDTSNDVSGDISAVNRRLHHLDRFLEVLKDFLLRSNLGQYTGLVSQLQFSVSEIRRRLEMDKTLNHGGRFEWIDSTLVQCLKEGSWLLIDNVNFCSASVLDRLNALVEPDGVLVINERGVIDGTVPTIVPHPDFRLFLSMDPRHGEISRAMRNRGIEIYIPGESDSEGFDRFDTKAMLHDLGLVGRIPTDAIIGIHEMLQQQFGREEHFGIYHLLQAASLASQMMERGSSLQMALQSALDDVYGHATQDRKRKQRIMNLIKTQLPRELQLLKIPGVSPVGMYEAGLWPFKFPSVSNWADEPVLSTVRQSAMPFLHLFDVIKASENLELVLTSLSVSCPQERAESLLLAASRLIFENCSVEGLPLAVQYLQQSVEKSILIAGSVGDDVISRRKLVQGVVNALETIQNHPVLRQLEAEVKQLTRSVGFELFSGLPLDWRWNEAMERRIRISCLKSGCEVSYEKWNHMNGLRNQIFLVYQISQILYVFTQRLADETLRGTLPFSIIQMSLAHKNGHLDAEDFPHPCVQFIAPFLSAFLPEVIGQLELPLHVTDAQLLKVLENLPWLLRFFEVCCQLITKQTTEGNLSDIALHWNWLHNQLIRPLIEQGLCFSAELKFLISQLQSHFGADDSAYKIREEIRSCHGHTMPFRTEPEAANCLKIEALSQCVDFCCLQNPMLEEESRVMKLASDSDIVYFRTETIRALSSVCWTASDDLAEVLLNSSNDLEKFLEGKGFHWSSAAQHGKNGSLLSDDDSVASLTPLEASRVNLWPMFGLLATMEEGHLVTKKLSVDNTVAVDFETLVAFACCRTALPATSLVPLKLIDVSTVQKVFDGLLMNYFGHLRFSVVCMNKCLPWNCEINADQINPDRIASSIFCASLSYGIFSVLTNKAGVMMPQEMNSNEGLSGLVVNCSLGEGSERLSQLKALNATLWSNAGLIGSDRWDERSNSLKLLDVVTGRLVESLKNFLPSDLFFETGSTSHLQLLRFLDDDDETSSQCPLSLLLPGWNRYLAASVRRAEELGELGGSGEYWRSVMMIGEAWVNVGILQCHLEAPQGPTDPNKKLEFELEHARNELKTVEEEVEIRRWNCDLIYGCDLESNHPLARGLVERKMLLVAWLKENGNKVAYRPQLSQYSSLLRETKHQMATVASSFPFIQHLWSAFEQTDLNLMRNTINDVKIFSMMCDEFIERLQKTYPLYRDVLFGFLSALRQMQYGLDAMVQALTAKCMQTSLALTMQKREPFRVEELVGLLASFPVVGEHCPSVFHLVRRLMSKRIVKTLFCLESHIDEESLPSRSLLRRIMEISLFHLNNAVSYTGSLGTASVRIFEVIFEHYVASWKTAEEVKRKKEEEESRIYRFKNIGETHTEEEKDEMEIKIRFPSFAEDFDDLRAQEMLNGASRTESIVSDKDRTAETKGLTDQEVEAVAGIHQSVFIHMTSSSWHQVAHSTPKSRIDLLHPALQSYEIASVIVKTRAAQLSPELEQQLIGGHLLMSAIASGNLLPQEVEQQNKISEKETNLKVPTRSYDIYHSANVDEVLLCRPVLEKFLKRINELLKEWPDHPSLKMLVTIISRIIGFPVTSSLMRFVMGLEMLLERSQDWQSIAASHVSITSHLDAVTELVIRWRKLELNCWKSCLDTVAFKAHQRSNRWFFHIYQLVEPHLRPNSSTTPEENIPELLKALHEFIELSPVGEYVGRLRILLAFHCHLLHAEPSDQLGTVQSIFWNVYWFYKQFLPNIEGFVAKTRAPIEKEIKDFVKIARWNDKNFYAVQAAVHKTHKTLHKHMKQFEHALMNSVSAILTETESEHEASHDQSGPNGCVHQTNIDKFLITEAPSPKTLVMSKVLHLSVRMSRFCRRIISRMPYENCIEILDEFTGSIIDGVRGLQLLSVDHIKDKEKQKSEVKHICQRKKKALTDLFRHLRKLGLSYQKGLAEVNSSEHGSYTLNWFTRRPCDVAVALSQMPSNKCDELTTSAWQGCDKYFVRALNRRTLFYAALQSPSKELGTAVIERTKGFAEHLSVQVEDERRHLVDYFYDFLRIRRQLQKMLQLNTSNNVTLPSQDGGKIWQEKLKSLAEQTSDFVRQLKLLLHCAPGSDQNIEQISPVDHKQLSPMMTSRKGDDTWRQGVAELEECESILDKVLQQVNKDLRSDFFITMDNISTIEDGFANLRKVSTHLSNLEQYFCVNRSSQSHGIAASVVYFMSEISSINASFEEFLNGVHRRDTTNDESQNPDQDDIVADQFCEKVDRTVRKCLKVVENFVKKLKNPENLEKETAINENQEEEELENVEEGLLTKIGKSLTEDMDATKLEQINHLIEDLVLSIVTWTNNPERVETVKRSVMHLLEHLPVFEQYVCLVQYLLTQRIASLRASAKLLTVLLDLFRGLAQKGFCLPEGYSDELTQEGATEFEDMEGGGVGEGEGTKDVSEQIESEDQVEGLQEGEKKTDKNDQDQPDIPSEDNAIEMSNDIDGKMHDFEKDDEDDENDENEDEGEEELDKKMGDLGEEDGDKLDEKLWGSDEEDELQEKNQKDEVGKGDGQQSQAELAAKDDRCQEVPDDKRQNQEEEPMNEPPDFDEDAVDENNVNMPPSDIFPPKEEEEAMELPDDLNLDENEDNSNEEGKPEMEENWEDPAESGEPAADQEPCEAEEPVEEPDDVPDCKVDSGKDSSEENAAEDEEISEEQDGKKEQEQEPRDETNSEPMELDTEEQQSVHQPGYQGAENNEDEEEKMTRDETDDVKKSDHGTVDIQEMEGVKDTAGISDETKKEDSSGGAAFADDAKGHEGGESYTVAQGSSGKKKKKKQKRRPGQSKDDRSLGNTEEKTEHHLKTIDTEATQSNDGQREPHTSDAYEHINDAVSQTDAQTLDAATEDQQRQQLDTDALKKDDLSEEAEMLQDDEDQFKADQSTKRLPPQKLTGSKAPHPDEEELQSNGFDHKKTTVSGERVDTATVPRSSKSSIYTVLENYNFAPMGELDVEKIRKILEEKINVLYLTNDSGEEEQEAQRLWQQYECLTSHLSQELCEQLRLILEPTQASKLRGDYRTGKRISMRKVIPYIASQFRKDKIWLRRTKPSKRQYQVMVAIDDSSSMVYNDSKQLAYESLAVISNALVKLEVGELSICSFGENVQVLHGFHESFTPHSGAKILQQLKFKQSATNMVQLLRTVAQIMVDSRRRLTGSFHQSNTAQLLLIVSDGKMRDSMKSVEAAIQVLREANIFVVFLVLDNPDKKESILDSKTVVMDKNGQVQLIKFTDSFPFPFYLILRDVHTLPQTLSDALRQWFELVTAADL